MLNRVTVKNLGCYDDKPRSIRFTEESVLVGPNNSGKSMILTGLNMLRWFCIARGIGWRTDSYNLFNFENAVYNHEIDKAIEIEADIDSTVYKLVISRTPAGREILTFLKNGARSTVIEEDSERMKSIWFIRPNRIFIPYYSGVQDTATPLQPISPDGRNISNFFLEKYTEQHPNWKMANEWFQKLDTDIQLIRTPIRGNQTSFEMMMEGNIPINIASQGSGIQSIAPILSALIFSPPEHTIVLEEPEAFLHSRSKEILVDLINDVVNNHNKQVIFSTHSFDIINAFVSDIGRGSKRGAQHVKADPSKFSLNIFDPSTGRIEISQYDLSDKTYQDVRRYFKDLWG